MAGPVRVLSVFAAAGMLVLAHPAARAGQRWVPPGDTIVRVTGSATTGFDVHRYDGTVLHLPTLSEAGAECTEYHRAIRRARCDAEVRTWYRDLGATKRALRYARSG